MTIKKNHLKEIRLARGLRQKDVAKLLGCKSEDRISHWEKGTAMPSVQNLFKLAQIYKVAPQAIYPDLFQVEEVAHDVTEPYMRQIAQ